MQRTSVLSPTTPLRNNRRWEDVSIPMEFTKAEFVDMWLQSDEPFDSLLARDLPPVIELFFNYRYLSEPDNGTITEWHYQGAEVGRDRLLDDTFGPLADAIARQTLAPVADYIAGQCVRLPDMIYEKCLE